MAQRRACVVDGDRSVADQPVVCISRLEGVRTAHLVSARTEAFLYECGKFSSRAAEFLFIFPWSSPSRTWLKLRLVASI